MTYLIILLPLVGFAVQVLFGRRLGDPLAGVVATVFVAASFVVSVGVFFNLLSQPGSVRAFNQNLWTWIPVGGLQVHAGLYVDPLSMTMVLFVTGISALIHLYSIGYMKGDRDYPKFFLYMNLFVASMLILVLGNNLLVTYVGWEGVGTCSYLLVAFWFTRESAAAAGKKAFIYNRIGDAGFIAAVFLTFDKVGSVDYSTIFANLNKIGSGNITAICLLLFVGVAAKSAQIPLFPWLADAMEGPTPVSALIHAATMVTAGVYLLCRINPLLHASPDAQWTVAIIGAATAFVAATIACAQDDIKKVLAYSTISQLGYMVLAIGCGAYEAAIFLMVAHAFFKGLLFLGAGSVIHGLHDEQDLKRMGNLRVYMPITFITFAVGWLAIAGVPPLSGFWAKGDILENTWAAHPALWAVGLTTAVLTAYYMSRLTGLAFFGKDRWKNPVPIDADTDFPDAHHAEGSIPEPHESKWVMTTPLVVLGVLAAAAGVMAFGTPHLSLAHWVDPVFGGNLYDDHESTSTLWKLGTVDGVVAVVGVIIGLRLWVTRADRPKLEWSFLRHSWYINQLFDAVIGRPGTRLAEFSSTVVEDQVIDGAVNGTATLVRKTGTQLRRVQTGYVRNYALWIVVGVVILFGFMLTRAWWS
ncbi:MAG TPA: NADH-quinone oxidoreductase subunit L [Acidimicrobiales bacterium]|nr:NADH-quinone oxidoreductase subunit L [Acidimicrobiales bacterium]